jgi:hypothetical protein
MKCLQCGYSFENAEDKHLHFIEDAREITYDLSLQEQVYGRYVRCMNDREMFLYYDGGMKQGFHLKKGVQARMKEDKAFISPKDLQAILQPFDLSASEVIRRLPEESKRGPRYNPSSVEKSKALVIARQLWSEA